MNAISTPPTTSLPDWEAHHNLLTPQERKIEDRLYALIGKGDSVDSQKILRLIEDCKSHSMSNSNFNNIALEILVPMYAYSVTKNESDDTQNSLKTFFEKSTKAEAQTKAQTKAQTEAQTEAQKEAAQTAAQTAPNKPRLKTLISEYLVKPYSALQNTCFAHAVTQVITKNPAIQQLMTNASPGAETPGAKTKKQLTALKKQYDANNPHIEQSSEFIAVHTQIIALKNTSTPDRIKAEKTQQHEPCDCIAPLLESAGINTFLKTPGQDTPKDSPKVIINDDHFNMQDITNGLEDFPDHTLQGIFIHTGNTSAETVGGITATSGHHQSLIKTGDNEWSLYNYDHCLETMTGSLRDVIEQIKAHKSYSNLYTNSTCKGIYAVEVT